MVRVPSVTAWRDRDRSRGHFGAAYRKLEKQRLDFRPKIMDSSGQLALSSLTFVLSFVLILVGTFTIAAGILGTGLVILGVGLILGGFGGPARIESHLGRVSGAAGLGVIVLGVIVNTLYGR